MTGDTLFGHIEKLQGAAPWGTVLDAGTGELSLEWILSLGASRCTAVTGDPGTAAKLGRKFRRRLREADRIVAGNWTDPLLLHGEVYSVVIADYLLGAIDGFAPYFQDRLFGRLRPHVGSRLYVVGLAPYPTSTEDPWGKVILELTQLRDACILLAGHRTYREYPAEWVLRHLEAAGFVVDDARSFPICYGARFVNECSNVSRRKLPYLRDRGLAARLEKSIEELRKRALAASEVYRGRPFGEDYVVLARPGGAV